MKIHKLTTPIGKAFYPRLQPDYKWSEEGQYTCKLHVEDEKEFNEFSAKVDKLVEEAYKEELKKQGKTKLKPFNTPPIRITDEGDNEIYAKQVAKKQTAKGERTFSIGIYDSQGNKLPASTNCGSGSTLRMSVELATWYVPALGFGYSLRLRAVQIIELVEYSGGGGADNAESLGFGEVKGGFVGDPDEVNQENDEEGKEANKESQSAVPF
jgi:hypothetical protein